MNVEELLCKYETALFSKGKNWKSVSEEYYKKKEVWIQGLFKRLLTKLILICDMAGLNIEFRDKETNEIIIIDPYVQKARANRKNRGRKKYSKKNK